MNAGPFARITLAAALVAAAAVAWLGYRRPDFLFWLGNSLFLCG